MLTPQIYIQFRYTNNCLIISILQYNHHTINLANPKIYNAMHERARQSSQLLTLCPPCRQPVCLFPIDMTSASSGSPDFSVPIPFFDRVRSHSILFALCSPLFPSSSCFLPLSSSPSVRVLCFPFLLFCSSSFLFFPLLLLYLLLSFFVLFFYFLFSPLFCSLLFSPFLFSLVLFFCLLLFFISPPSPRALQLLGFSPGNNNTNKKKKNECRLHIAVWR